MRRGSASSYPLGVVARVALGVDEVEEGVELDGSFEDDDDVEFVVAGASAGAAVEERLVPGVAVRLGLERVDVGDEGLRRRSRGAGRRVSLREIVIARKHLVQGVVFFGSKNNHPSSPMDMGSGLGAYFLTIATDSIFQFVW